MSTAEGIGQFEPERYKVPEGTPKTGIVIGAGCRGHGYSFYAKYHPDQFKVLAFYSSIQIGLLKHCYHTQPTH